MYVGFYEAVYKVTTHRLLPENFASSHLKRSSPWLSSRLLWRSSWNKRTLPSGTGSSGRSQAKRLRRKYLSCILQPPVQVRVLALVVSHQVRPPDDGQGAVGAGQSGLSVHSRLEMKWQCWLFILMIVIHCWRRWIFNLQNICPPHKEHLEQLVFIFQTDFYEMYIKYMKSFPTTIGMNVTTSISTSDEALLRVSVLKVASWSDLAETFEVLCEVVALLLWWFPLGNYVHGERSKLHQNQVLRKVVVSLCFLQQSTWRTEESQSHVCPDIGMTWV